MRNCSKILSQGIIVLASNLYAFGDESMSNKLYFMDNMENEKINAKLLYVTKSKYGDDWHSSIHSHHFTEFFFIAKGSGTFIVEEKSFPIKECDMIIVNPNVSHTKKSLSEMPLEYIAFGVQGISFSFSETKNGGPDVECADTYSIIHFQDKRDAINFYLNTLVNEAQSEAQYSKVLCQNILEIILIGILRKASYHVSVDSTSDVNQACVTAKRYIDSHYKESISLDDLAQVTHINKYYLAHVFTTDYKMSPISYLITRRLEESKNLLRSTNYSIAEVSHFSGFSSPSYFSQAFKKNTGMRPAEYRQKHRNGNILE